MPSLARGQASDCSNPVLDIFTTVNGVLTDVATLEFQIWEKVTNPLVPAQIYPGSGRAAVDTLNLCPVGGKVSTGRFVAEWTPALTDPTGTWEIRWFFKLTGSSPEQTWTEEFEVLPEVVASGGPGYCTVQDLRDEGVPDTGPGAKTDSQLQTLIARVSRKIDLYTGRFFEPRSLVLLLDGHGRRPLLVGPPIIEVTQIRLVSDDFVTSTAAVVDLGDVKVYNRHLSGLLDPDDRENPRIEWRVYDQRYDAETRDLSEFLTPQRWPAGTQNVEVTGVFGYTDPDGSSYGMTPDPIREAATRMAIKSLSSLLSPDAYDDANAWRMTELRTRDQMIKWANPADFGSRGFGAFTGDPVIDSILAAYSKPPSMGAP